MKLLIWVVLCMFIHLEHSRTSSFIMITNLDKIKSEKNSASYVSDTFAMIGTIFLWMYWPSFNGALADGNSQHRVLSILIYH